MKRVLAIGAHPDDIEFGCGGTIYKHKLAGDFVAYLCMTSTESVDGVTGTVLRTAEENQHEVHCAAEILKCDAIEFLPFTDLKVPFSFESVSGIEAIIRKYEIDTIYTHWTGDANQDHIATFKATMAASRYVQNVFCYEQIPVPRMSENPMNINYYVDVTDSFDKKIQASNCHKSQMVKYKAHGFDVEENLRVLAQFRGIQAQCKYAEAFQVIKLVKVW
jgi:N-acetylglucosamine malate deacetylase 1